MSFPRPIQWYRSHAVIIWPVRTFNFRFQIVPNELSFCPFFLIGGCLSTNSIVHKRTRKLLGESLTKINWKLQHYHMQKKEIARYSYITNILVPKFSPDFRFLGETTLDKIYLNRNFSPVSKQLVDFNNLCSSFTSISITVTAYSTELHF